MKWNPFTITKWYTYQIYLYFQQKISWSVCNFHDNIFNKQAIWISLLVPGFHLAKLRLSLKRTDFLNYIPEFFFEIFTLSFFCLIFKNLFIF